MSVGIKSATPGPGGSSSIRRLEAKGNVVVTQKDQVVTGEKAVFDTKANSIAMSGGVVLTQCANVMRGDRLFTEPLAQMPRRTLGHLPRIHEDQRRLVTGDELGETVVVLLPDLVRHDRVERRARDLNCEIDCATMALVNDHRGPKRSAPQGRVSAPQGRVLDSAGRTFQVRRTMANEKTRDFVDRVKQLYRERQLKRTGAA